MVERLISRLRYFFLLKMSRLSPLPNNVRSNELDRKVLSCFWDLETQDITFMIVPFLIFSELRCKELSAVGFRLVVVPTVSGGVKKLVPWTEYTSIHGAASRTSRLHRIVLAACRLHPMCLGVHLCSSRQEARMFEMTDCVPPRYRVDAPTFFRAESFYQLSRSIAAEGLAVPADDLEKARGILNKFGVETKFVCISIRDQDYDFTRNSPVEELKKFCSFLNDEGVSVVIIPDTDKFNLDYRMMGFVAESASFDLGLRLAIHSLAYYNILPNGGVANLSQYTRSVKFVLYGFANGDSVGHHSSEISKELLDSGGMCLNTVNQRIRREYATFDRLKEDYLFFVKG